MTLRGTYPIDGIDYGFEWLRAMLALAPLQEGVFDTDFKVTSAAAGGQRVDVAAGHALVKGDSGTPTALYNSQGLYVQVNDASIANAVSFDASHATLPRVDQVVLTINDSSDLGSGGNAPVVQKVTGTATAGASLDNRSGAAPLPANSIRLADVLIPAASTAVSAGNVRDRRPWARGAHRIVTRTAGDVTSAGTSLAEITSALATRIECSGVPLRVTLDASFTSPSASQFTTVAPLLDGVPVAGMQRVVNVADVDYNWHGGFVWEWVPAPGSHVLTPAWATSIGQHTMYANGSRGATFVVEELIRQNVDNA